LHLEASEFTEALRGKGDFEQEAADVLFVLLSTMEAHNIGVDWVLEILEQRLKDAPTEAQKENER
jgi:phosphoribosyl-ATP pyrophosphohydrolase